MDGVNTSVPGGWVDHNWKQLYIQFAYVLATSAYTFVMTALVAKLVDMIPGLKLRSTPEGERVGMDEVEVSNAYRRTLLTLTVLFRSENSLAITLNYAAMSQTRQHLVSEDLENSPNPALKAAMPRRRGMHKIPHKTGMVFTTKMGYTMAMVPTTILQTTSWKQLMKNQKMDPTTRFKKGSTKIVDIPLLLFTRRLVRVILLFCVFQCNPIKLNHIAYR